MPLVYYITDYAYTKLVDTAKNLGYIDPNALRAKGLSEFLDKFSECEFVDNRPEELIIEHEATLQRSSPPRWTIPGEYRKPRLLSITDSSIINYLKTGIKTGVIITRRLINPGRLNRSDEALVATVLEAIGLELLVPTQLPPEKKDFYTSGAISRIQKVKRTRIPDTKLSEETSLDVYFKRGIRRP